MPRSSHGGRHELGQNFLNHEPTIAQLADLARRSPGPVLEIGAGDGALTRALHRRGCRVTAIDVDEHRVRALRRALPDVRVEYADALRYPLTTPTVVGNIPFHLTTPILRRLLRSRGWRYAVLLTQWEVARKRAGVGGRTMMTAQAAPWFEFALVGRVPARRFTPVPSVDGGILTVARRGTPLVEPAQRPDYERFVHAVFTGRGGNFTRILQHAARVELRTARRILLRAEVAPHSLPRDLDAPRWAALWHALGR
ncbi:MAG: 23S ribosomal RNA methyltransferase Erm [Propionibacterium sp.]|nr:23S ribosomal RNA methyltransferase Erm [Propionibacterium sp.]